MANPIIDAQTGEHFVPVGQRPANCSRVDVDYRPMSPISQALLDTVGKEQPARVSLRFKKQPFQVVTYVVVVNQLTPSSLDAAYNAACQAFDQHPQSLYIQHQNTL